MVGKVVDKFCTENPLKHESDMHGASEHLDNNFDPAVYHYLEVTMQQALQDRGHQVDKKK